MTSTRMVLPWLYAVACISRTHFAATSAAVSNPKVNSVPQMSLSMVLGSPMTLQPSAESMAAVLCVPAPPNVTRQSSPKRR